MIYTTQLDAIKTSDNVEFEVIYADGTRYRAAEGVLFEAKGEDMFLHLGTGRPEVLFSVAIALTEVCKRIGVEDAFISYIKRAFEDEEHEDADGNAGQSV